MNSKKTKCIYIVYSKKKRKATSTTQIYIMFLMELLACSLSLFLVLFFFILLAKSKVAAVDGSSDTAKTLDGLILFFSSNMIIT